MFIKLIKQPNIFFFLIGNYDSAFLISEPKALNTFFVINKLMTLRHRFAKEEYLPSAQFKIKYKDYIHLKNLYIMMHEWVVEEGYATRKDEDFKEEFYLQRETQKAGKEIWFWWRLEKHPQSSSYYAYWLDVDVRVILLKDVEVMHQGQKFKTNYGYPEIRIDAKVILDYHHTWRKHWLLKNFNKFFHQRIYHGEVRFHRLQLYRDAYRFSEAIKTFLKMRTFMPEPELQKFYSPLGMGDIK